MICTDLTTKKEFDAVPDDRRFVVALGNFDGVHIAHRRLVELACRLRDERFPDAHVAAWYFSDLPENYLPVTAVERLSDDEKKRDLLSDAGAEYAFSYEFPDLCNLSPDVFIERILTAQCHAVGVVCGYNFRFGKNAVGAPEQLRIAFPNAFAELPEVKIGGITVSSTAIRKSLRNGDVETATALLGRPFSLTSTVTHGKHLGTKLGIPTVNQTFRDGFLIPRHGVYATVTTIDGRDYASVSNIGVRPTVERSDRINCETHILSYSDDLYGKCVTVSFLRFLRDECRFASVEQLQAAIQKDIETARNLL